MNRSLLHRIPALLKIGALFGLTATVRGDPWVTGYYPGYRQSAMPPSAIDFGVITHVIHFSVMPNPDGTLDTAANKLTPARSADLVTQAHAAHRLALICVGGAQSQLGFRGATASANRAQFINHLIDYMSTNAYDGVDVDWEPLDASDALQYTNFVNGLRTALSSFQPNGLLTVAVAEQPSLIAGLQDRFDQINLMAYDLSGPYAGWVTWFNSPIFDGGYRFHNGRLVPSTDGMVSNFLAAGIAPGKLGVGTAFYGMVWSGGTGTTTGGAALPRQSWTNPPSITPVAFTDLMTTYYQSNLYHWDTNAQAAYLSIDKPGSSDDKFISYDDEHSCQAKISYLRNRGLGGLMIWELGQGYSASLPEGQRDPLVQAIKQALATPRFTGILPNGQTLQIHFTSLPLADYEVQWTSNLAAPLWNTLTNDLPGTGDTLQIMDANWLNSSQRFYRVLTPPFP